MNKTLNLLCDVLIIVAAVSLVLGIITRIVESAIIFGVTSQAFLQFTQGLLLFAIALGIRGLLKK
ncbi:MAG: hypothetical protein HQ555_12230 [Candidatus Aminicenantes bacterium]|nr:hypothetical protein [Candidatus Aminicenantes bacterium]